MRDEQRAVVQHLRVVGGRLKRLYHFNRDRGRRGRRLRADSRREQRLRPGRARVGGEI